MAGFFILFSAHIAHLPFMYGVNNRLLFIIFIKNITCLVHLDWVAKAAKVKAVFNYAKAATGSPLKFI
ncbi:hypothetical protein CLV51_10191 [Chitinophaga niastensis]|uniref:Uncharacterized protein n=1 Tax=Chitinophaga niastensis TaxID=536980 RepID=A0A2P8HRC9_CHINA|nr:hypothetical protein [Chitinophaga niastensis]PSL48763.1 hypothetical protein CLV51_10191 [Chitinophaga niastensis]